MTAAERLTNLFKQLNQRPKCTDSHAAHFALDTHGPEIAELTLALLDRLSWGRTVQTQPHRVRSVARVRRREFGSDKVAAKLAIITQADTHDRAETTGDEIATIDLKNPHRHMGGMED